MKVTVSAVIRFVWIGDQIGLAKSVHASTTVVMPLAQEMVKPKFRVCDQMVIARKQPGNSESEG